MLLVTVALIVWAAFVATQKPKAATSASTEVSKPVDTPTTQNEPAPAKITPKQPKPSTGKNQTSGNGTQAAGDNSSSIGSVTQGPCSVLQSGGSHNQAQGGTCITGPPDRVIAPEKVAALIKQFSGLKGSVQIGVVGASGTTGHVTVTTPSHTLTSSQAFKVLPAITSFTPTSGPVGRKVTIIGSGFIGATKVTFGGVKAISFTVNSGTQITATVPTGAKTGNIAVTTPGGIGIKGIFTVS